MTDIPCWCGEAKPCFADVSEGLEATCGGLGILDCFCGGDLCICHNHGSVECPGCDECEDDIDEFDDDYDD